jgi:putative SOS response-associated peptidase YedK
MEEIHNRQPVMLPRDALDKWLDPSIDGRDLMPIQRPGIPDDLEVTAVDWMINNSREKHKPAPLIDREVLTIGSC